MNLKEFADSGGLMMPEIELEIKRLEDELSMQRTEVKRWRDAHGSIVIQKRILSAKYGAIMARKPAARWRRAKRRVTKLTHKLRRVR